MWCWLGLLLFSPLALPDDPRQPTPPAPHQAGCQGTEECREEGRCHRAPDGGCVARSRADCERSTVCIEAGSCTPVGGECVVRSHGDCLRSRQCKEGGQCVYRPAQRGDAGRPGVTAACVNRRDLKCNCPPPGHPSAMEAHRRCLANGGGWGPHCGAPRPAARGRASGTP